MDTVVDIGIDMYHCNGYGYRCRYHMYRNGYGYRHRYRHKISYQVYTGYGPRYRYRYIS